MNAIHIQKIVANKALDMMYLIDPCSIVAGGAVRDWYFDKEATDIDLFFHCPQASTLSCMEDMLKKAGFEITEIKRGDSIPEWYKKNPYLKAVYNTSIHGVKVQLMRMSKPTWNSVLDKFPLSICKAWWKNSKAHYHKDFLRSVKFKAIYKTNDIYNNEHQYIQKILAKFPEMEYYDNFDAMVKTLLDQERL